MFRKLIQLFSHIMFVVAMLRAAQGLGILTANALDELVYQIQRRKTPNLTRFESKYK